MLPRFFTCAELIQYCGGREEWAKDPRLTGAISAILRSEGYTQRMVHRQGTVHRQWSRHWKTIVKKKRTWADPDGRAKEVLIERIQNVVRVGAR